MRKLMLLFLTVGVFPSTSWAVNGNVLALRSNGAATGGTAWQINDNGYVGTYITLAAPGSVTVTVNAQGTASGGVDPFMNIVINDTEQGWSVGAGAANYEHTFDLPAGTHFIRTEFNNDGDTGRALRVNTLDVVGATVSNSDNSTNALDAADTYIANYRRGDATLYMPAVEAGTQVHVKLKNHTFNFGTNIPGTTASQYFNNANFQQFVKDHFNMVVPSNAGKWSNNEGTRDTTSMSFADTILTFAENNNMRARMHALAWGDQQPSWVYNSSPSIAGLVEDPTGTDTYSSGSNPQGTNLNKLDALYSDLVAPAGTPNAGEPSEIDERIGYYIGDGIGTDRADRYVELDVYNESYHTGSNSPVNPSTIWTRYGPAGVAKIYDDAAAAVALAGANVRLYTNEYSVLENQGGDAYANWYRDNIEDVENADGDPFDQTVSGVGIQYYSHTGHQANLMQKALQNLSVLGLPMTLTEFGVQSSVASDADRIRNVTEAHRMMFGTPQATGFLYWGWWQGATDPTRESSGVLVDLNWNLTPVGVAWEALRDSWDTDEMIAVAGDGTIDFTGYYGDYEITIGSQTFDLTLGKGGASDFLFYDYTIPGDVDGDGDADIDDLLAIKNHMNDTGVGFGMGDTDGDGDVDGMDLANVKDNFGMAVTPGPPPGLAVIPEPASLGLLSVGGLMLMARRRRL